jgi:Family of unknown function (DUF5682)
MDHPQICLLGVRHHGPGSARAVAEVLAQIRPDCILIEGPSDASEIIDLVARDDLVPPVALLVHAAENPKRAVFYPFAQFSPEWIALRYGVAKNVPIRWMDLSVSQRFSLEDAEEKELVASDSDEDTADNSDNNDAEIASLAFDEDPLDRLAVAAGYDSGETFWDEVLESNRSGQSDLAASALATFEAITQMMVAVRQDQNGDLQMHGASAEVKTREALREAQMRQTLRAAIADNYQHIVVVCGAWHTPALLGLQNNTENKNSAKADNALIKESLASTTKVKTSAAWAPWSFDRLSMRSGYGAGVASPQWYQLLWELPSKDGQAEATSSVHFITAAARLLRDHDLEASSASIIEAVRLAAQLAAIRKKNQPGLEELLQSVQSVLLYGQTQQLQLIHRQLVIGSRLGQLPANAPTTPLYADFLKQCKTLRLTQAIDFKDYDLDLRKETDLARSQLLHRLRLLGINWGEPTQAKVRTKGTFHEWWRIAWQPEFVVEFVMAARLGATVAEAAQEQAFIKGAESTQVMDLVVLLDLLILADLPIGVSRCVDQLNALAAGSKDTLQMMQAFGRLAQTRRYGNVRQSDSSMLDEMLAMMATRISIGVNGTCYSLDDAAASIMREAIQSCDAAYRLMEQPAWQQDWLQALAKLADTNTQGALLLGSSGTTPSSTLHGLIAGLASRLVYNSDSMQNTESGEQNFDSANDLLAATRQRMFLALSAANAATYTGAWIEGFNSGGAGALLHDDALWRLLTQWLEELAPDHFIAVLPLLRRSFSLFVVGERNAFGDKALNHYAPNKKSLLPTTTNALHWNAQNAQLVLPVLSLLFNENET